MGWSKEQKAKSKGQKAKIIFALKSGLLLPDLLLIKSGPVVFGLNGADLNVIYKKTSQEILTGHVFWRIYRC